MASDIELRVVNPTDELRYGPVSAVQDHIPYDLLEDSDCLFLVKKGGLGFETTPLQLDRLADCGSGKYSISFVLKDPIKPGSQETFLIKQSPDRFHQYNYVPNGSEKAAPVVDIYNHRLFVSLSLAPEHSSSDPSCFAGAARSIRLHGREMLDSFAVSWEGHDPEKRCLQIDRLQLWHAGSRCCLAEEQLFARPYEFISQHTGPVRTAIVLLSSPFSCRCPGRPHFDARLRRAFSIYHCAEDYLMEELSLCGGSAMPEDVEFSARYYANMDLDPLWPFGPEAVYAPAVPADWLVLGNSANGHHFTQSPGYGFASDVQAVTLNHPHPASDGPSAKWRTFSWELARCREAKCFHVFIRRGFVQDGDFNAHVGRLWDAQIARPLEVYFAGGASTGLL